jgi:hypothetical protein
MRSVARLAVRTMLPFLLPIWAPKNTNPGGGGTVSEYLTAGYREILRRCLLLSVQNFGRKNVQHLNLP